LGPHDDVCPNIRQDSKGSNHNHTAQFLVRCAFMRPLSAITECEGRDAEAMLCRSGTLGGL